MLGILNNMNIYLFNTAKKTHHIQGVFLLGKIIKIFIVSILQRRLMILKEFFFFAFFNYITPYVRVSVHGH